MNISKKNKNKDLDAKVKLKQLSSFKVRSFLF